MHSFGPIRVYFHYKIQVHSKERYTIVLYIPNVLEGIKMVLHYELQLFSKKWKYYCIISYNCIQGLEVLLHCKMSSKKEIVEWYELYTGEENESNISHSYLAWKITLQAH